jgi:hypothetical protein
MHESSLDETPAASFSPNTAAGKALAIAARASFLPIHQGSIYLWADS